MNSLGILLQKIKDNPVMYLNEPSITNLRAFLDGYLSQRIHLGLDRDGAGDEGFQEWIQEKANTKLTQSWAGIILSLYRSEESAFYRFFDLFEEFLKRNNSSRIHENKIKEKFKVIDNDLRFRQFDIYNELLGSLKKRPGMYLGSASITRLDILLRGYSLARREVGILPTESEKEFEGFQSWVQEKYGIKTGQSWSKIILFYSIDEPEALAKFFGLYEEYLNQNQSLEVDKSSSE